MNGSLYYYVSIFVCQIAAKHITVLYYIISKKKLVGIRASLRKALHGENELLQRVSPLQAIFTARNIPFPKEGLNYERTSFYNGQIHNNTLIFLHKPPWGIIFLFFSNIFNLVHLSMIRLVLRIQNQAIKTIFLNVLITVKTRL